MYTLYSSVYATLPVTGDVKMVDVWLIHGLLNPFVVFMVLIASQMLTCKYEADIKQNKIDEGKAQTLGKLSIDSPKKDWCQRDQVSKCLQISYACSNSRICVDIFHCCLKQPPKKLMLNTVFSLTVM